MKKKYYASLNLSYLFFHLENSLFFLSLSLPSLIYNKLTRDKIPLLAFIPLLKSNNDSKKTNFYVWIRDSIRSFEIDDRSRHSSNRFLYYVEEVAKLYNCFLDARQISTRPDKYIRIRGRRPLASSAFVSVFHGLIGLSISTNSRIRSFSRQNGACMDDACAQGNGNDEQWLVWDEPLQPCWRKNFHVRLSSTGCSLMRISWDFIFILPNYSKLSKLNFPCTSRLIRKINNKHV